MSYPTTAKGWAAYAARMFKTIKPLYAGGKGLGDNRNFETPFEGGHWEAPVNSDEVVEHLRGMVAKDLNLAAAVLYHHNCDRSGIVGLADIARDALTRAIERGEWRTIDTP